MRGGLRQWGALLAALAALAPGSLPARAQAPLPLGGDFRPHAQVLGREEEVQRFVAYRTQSLLLVGSTPPFGGLERLLAGKSLTVVTGEADRGGLGWLQGARYSLRLLPGRVRGGFLLADDRYLIARQQERWLLLDHPPTVLALKQQLLLALQGAGR